MPADPGAACLLAGILLGLLLGGLCVAIGIALNRLPRGPHKGPPTPAPYREEPDHEG